MATELDSMIIRLFGDGSSAVKMFKDVEESSKQATDEVEKHKKEIGDFTDSVEKFAQKAVQALGALGIAASLKGAFHGFAEEETTLIHLRAAIEANGMAVEPLMERYEKLVTSITHVTTASRDNVLALLKEAETYGVTGDSAERAVRNALALASATGQSAQSMIRVTAMGLELGHTHALHRMQQLRGLTNDAERVAKVWQLIGIGAKAQANEFDSAAGKVQRLHNAFSEFMKEVGGVVAEFALPLIDGLRSVVEAFKTLSPAVREIVLLVTTAIAAFAGWQVVAGYITPILGLLGSAAGPLLAIAVGVGFVIEKTVGLGKAWEATKAAAVGAWTVVQDKIAEFVAWFAPIAQAASDIGLAIFAGIKDIAVAAWGAIEAATSSFVSWFSGIWRAMFGDAKLNWDLIRDSIVLALNVVEFTLTHLSQVGALVWAQMKRDALIAGDAISNALWGTSGESDATTAARADATRKMRAIIEDFVAWRRNKLAIHPDVPAAAAAGAQVAAGFTAGFAKEMHKFDAAVMGSAEAISRLVEYRDKYLEGNAQHTRMAEAAAGNAQALPLAPVGQVARQAPPPAAVNAGVTVLAKILEQIELNTREPVQVQEANLE